MFFPVLYDLIVKETCKYCECSGYVDKDDITWLRIECTINEKEKVQSLGCIEVQTRMTQLYII